MYWLFHLLLYFHYQGLSLNFSFLFSEQMSTQVKNEAKKEINHIMIMR